MGLAAGYDNLENLLATLKPGGIERGREDHERKTPVAKRLELTRRRAERAMKGEVQGVITRLGRCGAKRTRDGLERCGIPSEKAFGVPVASMQRLAKRLGRNHELAAALWDTGWYEARMMASFVDEPFLPCLPLVERAATDARNFVKKAVSWALRAVGRRNRALNRAALTVARRLSASPETAARWVGRNALRDLTSPAVTRRLSAHRS
jgi:3-methyladenine DNA glycosylase AlkD